MAQDIITEPTLGEVYFDRNSKLYTLSIEIKRLNVENMKGQIVGCFGRYAIVQVTFYDLVSNWSQSEADRNLILGSFNFDPASKYEPIDNSLGTSKRADKSAFKRLLEAFVGGAGSAMVIGLVIIGVLFLKGLLFSKGKEDSSSDSEQE